MADEAHSLFSASGSDAWGGPCPGKPAMEHGRKTTSKYADEGTAAHTLAGWVLDARLMGAACTAREYLGKKITVRHIDQQTGQEVVRVFTVDDEMAEHVDGYVDRCMLSANASDAERGCEAKSNYADLLGVPKDLAWGTTDFYAILWNRPALIWEGRHYPAGDELVVRDLKYGGGRLVEADTMQLRLYAVGIYWLYEPAANFTRIRLCIDQPRKDHLDEIVLTPAELLAEVATLKPNVPRVRQAWAKAQDMREAGASDLEVGEALYDMGLLGVSDKGCAFCDAVAVCPAMIADVGEGVSGRERVSAADFEDLDVDGPEDVREYGANFLAAAYSRLGRMELFAKAVRAEIDRRVLLKGETFDGVKVVAGKRGARAWIDAGDAEALARAAPKPIRDLLYKVVLKTPTQIMDSALKTSPVWAAKFAALIHQPQGKPAVVSVTDKRAAISHKAVKDDFEDLTLEDNQPDRRAGAAAGSDRHPFR